MTSEYNVNHPPLFPSGHYYSKNHFQFPITATNHTIVQPTVLKNNNGITMLYFRNGEGNIIVNSRSYPIQRGILMCLGSYHYFQIKPSNQSIELIQCRLSYDAFLYMAANPYYEFSQVTLNIHPLNSLLEGDMLKRTETLLEELVETSNKSSKKESMYPPKDGNQRGNITNNSIHKSGKKEFLLCMKLMGIFHKTYRKDFGSE